MTIDLVKLTAEGIAVSSIAHTFLPPWEIFSDFPRFQKWYKMFVYIVGYAAMNGRSTVYQKLSTESGSRVSDAVTNGSGNGKNGKDKNGVIPSPAPASPPVNP